MQPVPFVAICTPVLDHIELPTQRCLDALRFPLGWKGAKLGSHGIETDEARKMLTEQALRISDEGDKVTHLMWIDADMTFKSDSLIRLIAHDQDIVGGLCFEKRAPYNPVIFKKGKPILDYPDDEVIEVDSTGAAFVLVKRHVFEQMQEGSWWHKQSGQSEDQEFFKRCRGRGHKVRIDTGCKVGHFGKVIINEEFAKRNGSLGGIFSVGTL